MNPPPADAGQRFWLSHHWPSEHATRCVQIAGQPVCRRCLALYPLGIVVGFASALGIAIWPDRFDPALIWLLCLPATIGFVGEAVGLIRYRPRQQSLLMAITALAFGKALGYELVERWSPEFWGPVAVFGGIWFAASAYQRFAAGTHKTSAADPEHSTLEATNSQSESRLR